MTLMTNNGAGQQRRSPVFILATPRSYSTVTVAMLAGHPQLYGFPELVLFTKATVGQLMAAHSWSGESATPDTRLLPSFHISGLIRAIAQLHDGSQDLEAARRAVSWLKCHYDWPTDRLMDYLLALVWPRAGLEKSPDTLTSGETLRRCVTAYPDARFIHLTRNPATALRSLREARAVRFPGRGQRAYAVGAASTWYLGNLRAVKLLASMPEQCWLRVRAEDLLAESASRLPDVLGWLGLDYDAQILERMQRTEMWQYANNGPSGKLFGGDFKFFRDPALRPTASTTSGQAESAEPDSMQELSDPMRQKIAELARYLGY
jgi:hypothetical protein